MEEIRIEVTRQIETGSSLMITLNTIQNLHFVFFKY